MGYGLGDTDTGEVLVLAVLPADEGQGVGQKLRPMLIEVLKWYGHARLLLGCSPDPAVRSYGSYRRIGWQSTGTLDAHGDEVLELECP